MHTIKVIAGGFILLGIFLLLGRWTGGGTSSALASAARYFIPIWLIAAGVNLWVGVARGYPVAEEIPYFIVVFAVPAAAAGLLWWRFSRG
jgi:hypothetical protein